jgi:NitT/TauT family transport system substrate-binding protein
MTLRGKITVFILLIIVVGVIWYLNQNTEIASSLGIETANKTSTSTLAKKIVNIDIEDETPLKVAVNIWPGFAPGFWFNNGAAPTKSSQYYKDYNLLVEFKIVDDFQQSREMWKSNEVDILWCTVDAFASEAEGLYQFGPQVFMQVDNSFGGDAVVATRDVATISEARGKKWAFAPRTPSHTLTVWALQSGDLKQSDIDVVPVDLAPAAADMFKKGVVQVATVWAPDDIACVKLVPGAHVLVNTKAASDIIKDGLIVKKSFLDKPENFKKLQAFAEGWFRASAALNSSETIKEEAANIISMPFGASKEDMLAGIKNAKLSNYGDNANFFNLNGTYRGMTGEKLYNHMVEEFSKTGYASPSTPSWRQISNANVVRSLNMTSTDQKGEEASVAFTPVTEKVMQTPGFANKKLTVNFSTGSYALTEKAKTIIDQQFVPYAQGFKYARIRVEGHTDNIGDLRMNIVLSEERAQAIITYLISEYNYDPNRFLPAKGYGPNRPLVPNTTEANRAKNRRTEFELIQE